MEEGTLPAAGDATPSLVPVCSAREFSLLRDLIYRISGIHLSSAKQALLAGRLSRRLRALGLQRFRDYYDLVADGTGPEVAHMLDCVSTNETSFFREPRQFDHLENVLAPAWRREADDGARTRKVRAWSAGCASGEEPYTLAMVLSSSFPASAGWRHEILATDLSTRVLDRARTGLYPVDKAKDIPQRYLKPYMLKGVGGKEGWMKPAPEIRSIVRFERLNLNDPVYERVGTFDLIFCRNVLIYFDERSRRLVIERLLSHLEPAGLLFLGHAESMPGLGDLLRWVGNTIYRNARFA